MTGFLLLFWLDFSISIEGSFWLLVFVLFVAILFSYFIYKHTIPPVNRFFRMVLFCLRSLALIVLIILLFHPILSIRHKYLQKQSVAILVDKSRSLQIKDSNVERADLINSILKDGIWEELNEDFSLHLFPFSNTIDTTFTIDNIDSLKYDGEGTDISGALEISKSRLLNQFYSNAILISDGIFNMGENPEFYAQQYGSPIQTIGVGDPTEKKDIVLNQVLTNDVVYANNRIPVDVTISHIGFKGKKIQVLLKQDNKIIDQQNLTLEDDNLEKHVKLSYLTEEPGFQKYQIDIPVLSEEFTRRNNTRNIVVKVLESKMRILLLAGEPGLDFKFIKRALEVDENIELTSLVQRKDGGFYPRINLNSIIQKDFQLFIFLGFPRWTIPRSFSNFLSDKLIKQKKPLFFFQGNNQNATTLRQFTEILPFDIGSRPQTVREVVVNPTILGEDSPIVLLTDNRSENQKNWNDLPPIFTFVSNFTPFADSDILLDINPILSNLPASGNYRKPILISRTFGEQKTLVFLGQGLWRWDFMMWGVGKSNNLLLTFLERSVRWLITRDELKRVRFTTDKMIYQSGNQVYMQAQVYTDDYRPVENASVDLQVLHENEQQEFHLESLGNGKYQTQFRVFEGGDYIFQGEAKRGDQFFGADTGNFSVGEFDVEFQQTKMNENLLQKVAQLSGGKYFTPQNFREVANELPVENKEQIRIQEINLWNEWLVLILFLLLLAFEWIIRRRKGML